MVQQDRNEVADLQFVFGRIVEDVEGDLVADAAPADEVVGDDSRQDFVQVLVKGSVTGPPGDSEGRRFPLVVAEAKNLFGNVDRFAASGSRVFSR